MLDKPRNLVIEAAKTLGATAEALTRTVTGQPDARSEAASKAAATRRRNADRRSESARQAAATRKARSDARSAASKRAARTRARRDARVDAMVEATEPDGD